MKLNKVLPLAIFATLACAPALFASKQKSIDVHKIGTTTMAEAATRATTLAFSTSSQLRPKSMLKQLPRPGQQHGLFTVQANRSLANGIVFGGYPVVGPDPSFSGFDGIDSTDSGNAVGFVAEPPDQGLSTNGKQVAEAVNLAFQVFSTTGKPLIQPFSLYALYNVSTAPNSDGTLNQLSDPRVFFDWESGHWFMTIISYKTTAAGALTGGSQVLVAVSESSDALSNYTIDSVDVSDASYGACPCLGDQPLLGLNQDGVYLNTNEYSTSTGQFQTALVTAINKRDLIEGASTVIAAGFDGLTLAEGQAFSVQPAFPAPGTVTSQNRGTEFFTSTLDFNGTGDNRVAVWAMTDTETLKDNVPNLNFQQTIVHTEEYSSPGPAVQKTGPYPLGMSLAQPEELLDSGDDRMEQLFYAGGKLYCAFNTTLLAPKGTSGPRTGGAWFAIQPKATFASLSASVPHQGYIGIPNESVLYPSFAVDQSGNGAIAFTITGPNYFPSTGYVHFQGGNIQPKVHLAGIGQDPEDGFSGYPQFGGAGVARWGDYGAAMISPDGSVWLASEYIPNTTARPRTQYTNWGTFISHLR